MDLRSSIRQESRRAVAFARSLDPLASVVLIGTALLIAIQFTLGTRAFYQHHVAGNVPFEQVVLGSWAWWFGWQGITGFIIPVLILRLVFRKPSAAIGLAAGDVRFAVTLAALYLPVVFIGTWILSNSVSFQFAYPHARVVTESWSLFFAYELLYLFYWVGWEYLWRGFVLFGTAPALGKHAILIQAVGFALMHVHKPPAEAFLSIVGGLLLGALVWRCRSFWIAVPIHSAQMFFLDFWCTLRIRSGESGNGLDALVRVIGKGLHQL